LPGRVRIAEERLDTELVQSAMAGELCAVVEGDAAAQAGRQLGKERAQVTGDGIGPLVRRPHGNEQSRLSLVHGQDRLAVLREQHQVGFPVARRVAVGGIGRPF